MVGTTNRSMAAMSGAWLRKKVRHPWLGGPRRLTMYLATLDCAPGPCGFRGFRIRSRAVAGRLQSDPPGRTDCARRERGLSSLTRALKPRQTRESCGRTPRCRRAPPEAGSDLLLRQSFRAFEPHRKRYVSVVLAFAIGPLKSEQQRAIFSQSALGK